MVHVFQGPNRRRAALQEHSHICEAALLADLARIAARSAEDRLLGCGSPEAGRLYWTADALGTQPRTWKSGLCRGVARVGRQLAERAMAAQLLTLV